MPMHHRQRFEPRDLPVGAADYAPVLRGVFRPAVGCALATALAASGSLRSELACLTDTDARDALGLPDAAGALRLFGVLEQSLWVA